MSVKRLAGRALQQRNAALAAQTPLCELCNVEGRVTAGDETDHIVPLSDGGTDAAENLWRLCQPCHAAKTLLDCGRTHRPAIGEDGWPSEPLVGLTQRQIDEVKRLQALLADARGGEC